MATIERKVQPGQETKITDKEEEEQERVRVKNSALDELINLLPFEMHVPGYKFCGPGTKLAERIKRGEVGINPLDEACRQHDLVYGDKQGNRRKADRVLAEYAFSRMLADETAADERTVAMMTACCMVSKITFEKFFSRIKRVLKKNKNKKKRVEEKKSKANISKESEKKKKSKILKKKVYHDE